MSHINMLEDDAYSVIKRHNSPISEQDILRDLKAAGYDKLKPAVLRTSLNRLESDMYIKRDASGSTGMYSVRGN